MPITIASLAKATGFRPQIDQMETLGTQIQWKDVTKGEAGTVLLAPETEGPPIHLHPTQQEIFVVRYGELKVYKKNQWVTLKEGDTLTIPAGTAHSYKNDKDDFVLFDFELTPKVRFKKMIQEMDEYVQEQKIKGTNFSSILYMCRVMSSYPDVVQGVKPPQFVVKIMATLSKVFQS